MPRLLSVLMAVTLLLHCTREEASGEDPLTPGSSSGCSDFDVRLVEGNSSYIGMVEACYSTGTNSSLWGPICVTGDTQWTVAHAMIVCNQLGLPPSDAAFIVYENVMGPYSYDIWCDAWDPPERLEGCLVDETAPTCNAKRAGGVICHVPEEKRCEEGDVRPVNGSRLAGRLEVCFKGVWGTVCKLQQWSTREASVVCRQLRFNNSANVKCSGNETNISECMYSDQIVGNCLHGDDAGVVCEAPPGSCRDEEIRLEGGSENEEFGNGIINVCYTGLWGTVCGKDWDEMDAVVACSQLGYAELVSTETRPIQKTDHNVQSLLSGVNCSGSEERLADCDHDGVDFEDTTGCARAFVVCKDKIVTGMPSTSPPDNSTTPSNSNSAMTSASTSSMDDSVVVIGSSVGAMLLLLAVVIVIAVVATLTVLRKRTVRFSHQECLNSNTASIILIKDIGAKEKNRSAELEEELCWQLRNKNMIISKATIHLSSTIGQGEFGLVYKGYVDSCGGRKLVAIKTSKALFSEREKENLLREMNKMASIKHVNVMTLIGVCIDGEMPLIIMPFMVGGCVLEYVRGIKERPLPTENIRANFLRICHQVAKGMEYLAACKFVHRDLAARNCMIDENKVIKVADFGLSEDVYSSGYFCQSREEGVAREEKVPIRWMAPESIESGRYNEKTDVWAFGVMSWEIFTFGQVPYSGIRAIGILNVLKSGERLGKPSNSVCSDHIYDVCWSETSDDRPNFARLVETLEDSLERESGYLDLFSKSVELSGD